MKAQGRFLVVSVEKKISKAKKEYLELYLTDLNYNEDRKDSRLRGGGGAFKAFYMGIDIEPKCIYNMYCILNIYSDGIDIQVFDPELISKVDI